MDDSQLLRYSRHILLDEIGVEGQQRILEASVLVVGLGGLGSAASLYLATAGVGHLTLVDHDIVDLTNLQRQIAHTQARVGQPKVESARQALLAHFKVGTLSGFGLDDKPLAMRAAGAILAYLREMATSLVTPGIGPTLIGKALTLRAADAWSTAATYYLQAFEKNVQTYPYFVD